MKRQRACLAGIQGQQVAEQPQPTKVIQAAALQGLGKHLRLAEPGDLALQQHVARLGCNNHELAGGVAKRGGHFFGLGVW